MKKILLTLLILCGITRPALSQDPAINFVHTLTDKIITDVLQSDIAPQEKLQIFTNEFNQALDLKSIGQFVLGIYWKRATPAQQDAFLKSFMDITTKTWADRFNLYTGQKIAFKGTRTAQGNQIYVDSTIEHNPPVEVIWRLSQKDGTYKIIDIIVEGVSMDMSYRNEYLTFLQKNNGNLPLLTQELQQKADTFTFINK